MSKQISRDELKSRIDNGIPTVLVEALPRRYYDEGHLPGAINIPHDAIEDQAARQVLDKDATIVVYCANAECRNSRIAATALRSAGYRDVREYVEGKRGWIDAGYPLEGL